MADARKNFAVSSVENSPGPAGTLIEIRAGQGSRFPTPPFNATVAPEKEGATPENAEIVRVTAVNVAGGTKFTVTRKAEGTTARTIAAGDRFWAGLTDATLAAIEAGVAGPPGPPGTNGTNGTNGAPGATGPPGNELALGIDVKANKKIETTDAGKSLDCTNTTTITIKVEKHTGSGVLSIPEGFVCEVLRRNAAVHIEAAVGVTIIPAPPVAGYYSLVEIGSISGLRKIDAGDNWVISGDVE